MDKVLNLFPQVTWDRYAQAQGQTDIFGWIKREDGKFDFLVLHFVGDNVDSFTTSSKDSTDFATTLGLENHGDCKRVEDLFPDLNVVHLEVKE